MSYPIFGNLSLGNVSGNIKLFVNHSGIGNLTGIGYHNNAMTFAVNQSATDIPEMTINRFGNVGIGTTNPGFPLDVTGNIRLGTGTTGNIRFGTSGVGTTQAGYIDLVSNNMTIMNQQNGNLILGSNNTEDIRILPNGNIILSGDLRLNQDKIHLGNGSGTTQGLYSIAIGRLAGVTQQNDCIAIGQNAGNNQEANAIAIGVDAGKTTQRGTAIAIGKSAGNNDQSADAIAIGQNAGLTRQRANSVAIGIEAGQIDQSANCVAIGNDAGNSNQSTGSVAIGLNAGKSNQSTDAVSIGTNAGFSGQKIQAVAIGNSAGAGTQGQYAIAIGSAAGSDTQEDGSVAVGVNAGATTQKSNSVAIGCGAGQYSQATQAIAIGLNAGQGSATPADNQKTGAIAIGVNAGKINQTANSIAIGNGAGASNTGSNSVLIGTTTSASGGSSVAIGNNATTSTHNSAIAIGDGATGVAPNSCVISQVRATAPVTTNLSLPLLYNRTTGEVFTSSKPVITITNVNNTPDNSYYNSFLNIANSVSGSGAINIPSAVTTFPATIDIFSSSPVTQTLISAGGSIYGVVSSTATYVIQPFSAITLKSNGTDWFVVSTYGNQTTNTISFGYTTTAPTLGIGQLGYSVTTTGTNTNITTTAFNALNNTAATGVSIPTAGVWLINYIGALTNTAITLSAGNVSFGLSFTPTNSGNTVFISTARIPIVGTAIYGAAGLSSFSLQGSHVYTGASTTVYLNCNLSAVTGLATRPCSLTLTRIA